MKGIEGTMEKIKKNFAAPPYPVLSIHPQAGEKAAPENSPSLPGTSS